MPTRHIYSGLAWRIALLFGVAASAEEAPPAKAFAAKGEQTCLKCHDEAPAINILDTVHAVKGTNARPLPTMLLNPAMAPAPSTSPAPPR